MMDITDIVLATGNAGKLREFQQLFNEHPVNIRPQSDFNVPDVPETGLTFVENALIKARHASELTNRPAMADDSGLEVDALQGAPGIYSARYAYDGASSEDNNRKLLESLQDIPQAQRTARFQCVLVYLRHAKDPTPLICQAHWEGRILTTAQGDNGFGYDPIFYVPTHQCAAANLDSQIKNQISHRAQALQKLSKHWR